MTHHIFNLEGRRAFVNLFLRPESAHSLFMWGDSANAYGEIDGRAVWIHGTFGDPNHSGINGQYYEVAIDREKALRNPYPSLEIVGEPRGHSSAQSLEASREWMREPDGKIKLHTYCNISVSLCRSMVYGRPSLQYARWSEAVERQWVANQIWQELLIASQPCADSVEDSQSWVRLDHRTAQHIANLGGFVLASSYNPHSCGHLVFLTEDPSFDEKLYEPSTLEGLANCLGLKCFHCGTGQPRITELGKIFPTLQSNKRSSTLLSWLDSVRLYCDRETWGEYARHQILSEARR
jgi:hypothetical protein